MKNIMDQKTGSALVITLIVVGVAAVVTAGLFLFPFNPDEPPIADDVGSTPQGIQEVVNANNQFAFDLYSELSKTEKENIFYSPYSMSAALAMTYEGARGQTAEEIKEVFHFPETPVLRPNFAAIYNEINEDNNKYELSTGNALWAQKDYVFLGDYFESVEKYYGGKAANLDFAGETEKSRQTINNFIEEQTNDKIKELLEKGKVNAMTRLILTNAIYFKGTWEWQFDKSDTEDMDFYITPENPVQTPMMFMKNEKARFNYLENGNMQVLELPYKGDKISMLILLPKEDLESINDYLTADKLEKLREDMKEDILDAIYLPKFEFDSKYSMGEALEAMGMPTAFSPDADFSGMTGQKDLYIGFVIHQAYVKVDEEGTEAAAATAVGMLEMSAGPPSEEKIFKADHPFIFIIQEKETGNILFMGRMTDPSKAQ